MVSSFLHDCFMFFLLGVSGQGIRNCTETSNDIEKVYMGKEEEEKNQRKKMNAVFVCRHFQRVTSIPLSSGLCRTVWQKSRTRWMQTTSSQSEHSVLFHSTSQTRHSFILSLFLFFPTGKCMLRRFIHHDSAVQPS